MSKEGSAVHTTVLEAVAIEAGVGKSSITMTSTPMTKAAPSVSDELAGDSDTIPNQTNDMTIIIASAAGGGGAVLLAVVGVLICRRAKQQNLAIAKNISVVPGKDLPQSDPFVEMTEHEKEKIREFNA